MSSIRASIEGGTLIYRDLAAGTEQKVENLNIDLSLARNGTLAYTTGGTIGSRRAAWVSG